MFKVKSIGLCSRKIKASTNNFAYNRVKASQSDGRARLDLIRDTIGRKCQAVSRKWLRNNTLQIVAAHAARRRALRAIVSAREVALLFVAWSFSEDILTCISLFMFVFQRSCKHLGIGQIRCPDHISLLSWSERFYFRTFPFTHCYLIYNMCTKSLIFTARSKGFRFSIIHVRSKDRLKLYRIKS